MFDYVIVHGSYGSPFENWFPWLYEKLTAEGKNVLVPQFPCGAKIQNYDNWKRVLDAYKHLINENTTFIGHSLAPAFIVDYLIDNNLKVKRLVLVAPFYGLINIPEFDEVNSPFFTKKDLSKISFLALKRICFISNNDPSVPKALSVSFSKEISAETIFVDNAGHFNASAGYKTFESLMEKL